ncbi:hypothetical protein BC833DRAFT_625852 [Globomyces pollinis-pini]|nr:hypothetical protein BC833DRAFT_625852 [Globomyces pollinis-pini]
MLDDIILPNSMNESSPMQHMGHASTSSPYTVNHDLNTTQINPLIRQTDTNDYNKQSTPYPSSIKFYLNLDLQTILATLDTGANVSVTSKNGKPLAKWLAQDS